MSRTGFAHLPLHGGAAPRRHDVRMNGIDPRRLGKILLRTYENPPADLEPLLSIEVMHQALNRAKIDRGEKLRAFKRLAQFAA